MRNWPGGGPKISSASREVVESASWDQRSPRILRVKEANRRGLKTAIMLVCLFPWLSDREDWLDALP